MPERDGYIPGVPCWVDTNQPDPAAGRDFYGGLFGWEFRDAMPEGSGANYFIGSIGGRNAAAISSVPEGAPQMATWNTYIAVKSADEAAQKVTDAGGTVMMEPFDVMDAGRMTVFSDPEGAVLMAWEAHEHIGAQVVNEHGTLNFNGLATRDVEGAKAFYGSVFGWTTLELPGGALMWTLPGYGDHLEKDNPDLRQFTREAGAPEEFVDVVASINPLPDGEADTPAHWSVTFGVDDADVVAAKAEELGGRVIAPPFDAPWVRMTVIADPQGATFIASKFVPENKDLGG
jgi:uncharacterized protein